MELIRIVNFFQHVSNEFDQNSTLLLKSWLNFKRKICISKQQLTFSIRCRKYNMIPVYIKNLKSNINFHSNSIGRRFDKFKKLNQFKLLNFEIKDLNINLNYLRKTIINIERELFHRLPEDLVTRFFEFSNHRITSFNCKMKHKSVKKFKMNWNNYTIYVWILFHILTIQNG